MFILCYSEESKRGGKPIMSTVSHFSFQKSGAINTSAVLDAVARRASDLLIKNIIVATCSGETAFAAAEKFGKERNIIAVTHVTGFANPNEQELSEADRKRIIDMGITVFTGQHAFGGVGRAVRNKLATYQMDEIMAYTLRTFGQGTKVAIEIALMAADAGLVRTDEDLISIGGTISGADTALILQPANSSHFFDLKVREIICKPSSF
jgi:hypothetical protein